MPVRQGGIKMKINKLTISNFKGIAGTVEFTMPKIAAIVGKNGIGKTSTIEAIKFALTGDEPEGEIIHHGTEAAYVTIELDDPIDGMTHEFTRKKFLNKPSKFLIDGKTTTAKALNEKLEQCIGISLDKVKILASSEIVAAMKPQEFLNFILQYIPEKLKLVDVMELVSESTSGMMDIIENNLPADGIDMETIQEFADMCVASRKELKKQLDVVTMQYEGKPHIKPVFSKEEIADKLEVLKQKEKEIAVYNAKRDAYIKAKASAGKYETKLKELKEQLSIMTAEKPNPADLKNLKDRECMLNETISNQKAIVFGAKSSLKQLEITLEALNKPICPVSPLITCHQDKSVAKEDVSASIEAQKLGIEAAEREQVKAVTQITEVRKQIADLQTRESLYEKKLALAKQIKLLEESKPEIPEEPEAIEDIDIASEKTTLEREMKQITDYEDGLLLARKVESIKIELSDYSTLVKATSDKGAIKTGVTSKYLGVFESLCNERSTKVRPEIDFKFISDNGVVVLMNNGKGVYLPYQSLSGGEKAYMLFILMDMLNALCGSNILFLDELSVVDEECFDKLLDIVVEYTDDYDHVVLAAVDHDDTIRSVTKHHIPDLFRMNDNT